VFRRIVIYEVDGFLLITRQDDSPSRTTEHGAGKGVALPTHAASVFRDRPERLLGHPPAPGDDISGTVGPVFGFDQHIEGGKPAIRGIIGENNDLAGAGRRSRIQDAGNEPLCSSDPRASRTDELG
jgi:hypothetical protein